MTNPGTSIQPIEPARINGGAGSTDAHYDDMEAAAAAIDDVSVQILSTAAAGHRYLVDPSVIASAVLDPVGAARFEGAMLGALDGEGGLSRTGLRIGATAVRMKAAVMTYRAVDEAQARIFNAAEFLTAPVTLAGTLAFTGGHVAGRMLSGDDLNTAVQRTITDHPGLVDRLVGSAPGTITFLAALSPITALAFALGPGLPTSVPEGAALLGSLYPDGSPRVTGLGVDDSILARRPPRGISDLMVGLNARNAGEMGEIDVRILETPQPDGSVQRSYIVDIPGTKVWPGPGFNPDVNDTGTNLHAVANEVTTYQGGVEEALRRAGAQANDPVLLIGHSQGGIVAANAARDFTQAGSFNVTHIVTAGSPVAQVNVPENVQVLSIENRHDIVPRLDARNNPDVSNWVTVVVERQRGTVGENHGLDMTYVGAAEGVDRSADPSVRAYLEGAGAFLNGQTVTTERFKVERVP